MATGTKGLLLWCKQITQNYGEGIQVTNMTTSWKNGLAFCAILHHYRPDLMGELYENRGNCVCLSYCFNGFNDAFRMAEDELGIPALLDAEDMVSMKVPDRLSIMTYVSQYYNYFKDKVPGEIQVHKIPSKKRHAEKADPVPAKLNKQTLPKEKEKSVKSTPANPCFVCGKTVYLMERFTAEGKLFHRVCVKCSVCNVQLKQSTYEYDAKAEKLFCQTHYKTRTENDRPKETLGKGALETKTLNNIEEDIEMADVKEDSIIDSTSKSPFKRNEQFFRKGIRPQSSPEEMQWEKVHKIKSKEEEHIITTSKPKAKKFLSGVIKRKGNPTSSVTSPGKDFANPAYQQHLELSKHMNQISAHKTWEDTSSKCSDGDASAESSADKSVENKTGTLSGVKVTDPFSNGGPHLNEKDNFPVEGEKENEPDKKTKSKSPHKKKLILRKKKDKDKKSDKKEESLKQNFHFNMDSENKENHIYDKVASLNSENKDTKKDDTNKFSGQNSVGQCDVPPLPVSSNDTPKKNDYENIDNFTGTNNSDTVKVVEHTYDNENLTKLIDEKYIDNSSSLVESSADLNACSSVNESSRDKQVKNDTPSEAANCSKSYENSLTQFKETKGNSSYSSDPTLSNSDISETGSQYLQIRSNLKKVKSMENIETKMESFTSPVAENVTLQSNASGRKPSTDREYENIKAHLRKTGKSNRDEIEANKYNLKTSQSPDVMYVNIRAGLKPTGKLDKDSLIENNNSKSSADFSKLAEETHRTPGSDDQIGRGSPSTDLKVTKLEDKSESKLSVNTGEIIQGNVNTKQTASEQESMELDTDQSRGHVSKQPSETQECDDIEIGNSMVTNSESASADRQIQGNTEYKASVSEEEHMELNKEQVPGDQTKRSSENEESSKMMANTEHGSIDLNEVDQDIGNHKKHLSGKPEAADAGKDLAETYSQEYKGKVEPDKIEDKDRMEGKDETNISTVVIEKSQKSETDNSYMKEVLDSTKVKESVDSSKKEEDGTNIENLNPFLTPDPSPKTPKKKINTNPFLESMEDLIFESDSDEFEDSNPFAEDARLERRDTLRKGLKPPDVINQSEENCELDESNPFWGDSSDEEVSTADDFTRTQQIESLRNNMGGNVPVGSSPSFAVKPVPKPRPRKRQAPKVPQNTPKSMSSPDGTIERRNTATHSDERRQSFRKKKRAPLPPQINENKKNIEVSHRESNVCKNENCENQRTSSKLTDKKTHPAIDNNDKARGSDTGNRAGGRPNVNQENDKIHGGCNKQGNADQSRQNDNVPNGHTDLESIDASQQSYNKCSDNTMQGGTDESLKNGNIHNDHTEHENVDESQRNENICGDHTNQGDINGGRQNDSMCDDHIEQSNNDKSQQNGNICDDHIGNENIKESQENNSDRNDNTEEENLDQNKSVEGNIKFYLHRRSQLPHDYCSIDTLSKDTGEKKSEKQTAEDNTVISNASGTSNTTPVRTRKEKRQAPQRPLTAQLSYDEQTIMKSVALRDKQPTCHEIEKELEFLETRQRELEMEGVVMEKKMRNTMAGEPEEAYLLTWFELVNQKNQLLRRENELIYMCQEMDFLKNQRKAEFELRKLMSKPAHERTLADQMREDELLADILNYVTRRSNIVEKMDEDRLREYEEDKEISEMMEAQGLKSPSHNKEPLTRNNSVSKRKDKKKEKTKKKKK